MSDLAFSRLSRAVALVVALSSGGLLLAGYAAAFAATRSAVGEVLESAPGLGCPVTDWNQSRRGGMQPRHG